MTKAELPSLKPVQVTEVSDDIRKLREDDVSKQKTILTARAIADVFKCDVIDEANPLDAAFYVTKETFDPVTHETDTRRLVDLDKVIYGGRRALAENGYTSGPASTFTAAFLEIYAVLGQNKLTWTKPASEYAPYNISDDEDQTTVREPFSPHLRQVLWAQEVSWTRVGTLIDDVTGIYEWTDWETLNNKRLHIVITDATSILSDGSQYNPDGTIVASPNTVYEIYTNVPHFVLPDAARFALGTMISVYQYPEQGEENGDRFFKLSATGVSYTERYVDSGTGEEITNNQFINAIPAVERNTKTISDIVNTDHLVAAQYDFEVVALVDSANNEFDSDGVTRHTWELVVSNEETDFVSGLAEILCEHTDNYIRDMIQYKNREYREETGNQDLQLATDPLIINRVISTSGYMKASVLREKNGPGGWSVVCRLADAKRTGTFTKVDTVKPIQNPDGTTTTEKLNPDPDKVYYTLAGADLYVLARDPVDPTKPAGFLTTFDENTAYFTLAVSNLVDYTDEIVSFDANSTHIGMNTAYRYVYRNQILQIIVTPSSNKTISHITLRDGADGEGVMHPSVEFFPDPHHSYISKAHLNQTAFTEKMVKDAQEAGELPTSQDEDKRDYPASTAAVIEMYNYLVGKLQARGLLFGTVTRGTLERSDESLLTPNLILDTYTSDGTFWVCPKMILGTEDEKVTSVTRFPFDGEYFIRDPETNAYISKGYHKTTELISNAITEAENFSEIYIGVVDTTLGWPKGMSNDDCRITVYTNERASANLIKHDEVENGVVHYDATEVTQVLVQVGLQTNIWIRTAKSKTPGGSWIWGEWLRVFLNKFTADLTDWESDYLSSTVIAAQLARGEPHLKVGRSRFKIASSPTTITVELPDPKLYTPGTKLTLELCGNQYVSMNVRYTKTNGSDPSQLYEHTLSMPSSKLTTDLDTYIERWECDGEYWYLEVFG